MCVGGCGSGWKYSTKQVFRGRVNFTQWTFSMYEHFTPHKHKENLMPSDDNGDLLTAPLLLQLPPISESISHIGCTSFEFQCQTFCHFATHKCVRCIQRIKVPLSSCFSLAHSESMGGKISRRTMYEWWSFYFFKWLLHALSKIDVWLSHKCSKCDMWCRSVCLSVRPMLSGLQRFESFKWKFNHQSIMMELIGVENSPSIDCTGQIMWKK